MSTNASVAFFPCRKGRASLVEAIEKGWLPPHSQMVYSGWPESRKELARAAAHMQL